MIQVIVTVLIISVLLSVAIPLYNTTQQYSKQKACEANMNSIVQAEEAYRVRNRQYLTVSSTTNLQTLLSTTPKCPSGTADYTVTCFDSSNTTVACTSTTAVGYTVWCNNTGAHVTGKKWTTSDGITFTGK
jgi:type IV pilus assembly protein PilA